MIKVAYTNIESKIKINGLLCDLLILMLVRQGCLLSMLLYNIVAKVLASFINADKRIKGIRIGDHEIKIANITDNTTIFLRDITCLNRIQVIWRLYEKDKLAQRQFFQKAKHLWGGGYKNRIHQPGQLDQSQFPIKYLKLILVNLFSRTPNGTK